MKAILVINHENSVLATMENVLREGNDHLPIGALVDSMDTEEIE